MPELVLVLYDIVLILDFECTGDKRDDYIIDRY